MNNINMTFQSAHRVGPQFAPERMPDAAVKAEPMFFNSSLRFAYNNGGPITRAFIETFALAHPGIDFDACVLDSRVHMLMPGFWPCIPGWHHDDVPRGADGQPDYLSPAYRAKHCLGLVNGHLAPTEFACGFATLTDARTHRVVYKAWDAEIEAQVAGGRLRVAAAPSGRLLDFDSDAFHRGTRASDSGWRWFARISWDTGRTPTDEIRQQVQVYMDDPQVGW